MIHDPATPPRRDEQITAIMAELKAINHRALVIECRILNRATPGRGSGPLVRMRNPVGCLPFDVSSQTGPGRASVPGFFPEAP